MMAPVSMMFKLIMPKRSPGYIFYGDIKDYKSLPRVLALIVLAGAQYILFFEGGCRYFITMDVANIP